MDSLKNLNDYELIYLIIMNDSEALDLLCRKYRTKERILYHELFDQSKIAYTIEDWFHDCDQKIIHAVYRYNPQRGCQFKTFLEHNLRMMASNVSRGYKRKARKDGSDRPDQSKYSERIDYESTGMLRDPRALDGSKIIEKMYYELIFERLNQQITDRQKKIVHLLAQGVKKAELMRDYGYSRAEIADLKRTCSRIVCEINSH